MRLHAADQRKHHARYHQYFQYALYALYAFYALDAALSGRALAQSVDEDDARARAEAEATLLARLTSGSLDRTSLASVYLRLGLLRSDAAAEEAFARAFALDPNVAFPDALDDATREQLAQRGASTEPIRISIETSSDSLIAPLRGDSGEPTVDIENAPSGLVRTLEVTGRNGFSRSVSYDGVPVAIAAPVDALPLRVRALDAHGNVIGVVGPPPLPAPSDEDAEEVPAPTPTPERPAQRDFGTTLIESPLFWVLVGLVVAGVAVGVGFTASGDRYLLDAPVVR